MRIALAISVVVHVLLWAVAALQVRGPAAGPAPQSMEVEIVRQDEAPEAPRPETADAPKPTEKPAGQVAEKLAEKPGDVPAERTPDPRPAPTRAAPPQQPAPSRPPEQQLARADGTPADTPPTGTPRDDDRADDKPGAAEPWSSWADSPLMNVSVGYETTARKAKLTEPEIAAFRAHLGACWQPPAGLADTPRLAVVLRVALQPNGALAGEPALLAASASPKGAVLLQTAMRALRQCQPVGVLPAAKYKEWRLLDLAFSPAGLTGLPKL